MSLINVLRLSEAEFGENALDRPSRKENDFWKSTKPDNWTSIRPFPALQWNLKNYFSLVRYVGNVPIELWPSLADNIFLRIFQPRIKEPEWFTIKVITF